MKDYSSVVLSGSCDVHISEVIMPVMFGRGNYLAPLTRKVFGEIAVDGRISGSVFGYAAPVDPLERIGGMCLDIGRSNELGTYFQTLFFHRTLFTPKNSYDFQSVIVEEGVDGKLHVHARGFADDIVQRDLQVEDFESDETPWKIWAAPIGDESFANKIIELGKGFLLMGEHPMYRFDQVVELAPGIVVVTYPTENGCTIYLCPERYRYVGGDPAYRPDYLDDKSALVIRNLDTEHFRMLYDDQMLKLLQGVSDNFEAAIPIVVSDSQFVSIVWQRRADCNPANWAPK